ncbi:MAG: ParB/RepB/Spo0J family partition protein [Clostridiales bacterium]|nr:ParB/RepB/Spo0J family partition protein [Clostridiales bacterium]
MSTKKKQLDSNQVVEIKLTELHPFKNHPFKVLDDELMQQTIDSISQVGVLSPAVVRPDPSGGYEIISGHRRLYACEAAGLETMPVIVKELTDDEAVIFMVDSNLQRENILPSERALAYKMKMEALKHQGKRDDLTFRQNGGKSWTVEKLSQDTGESVRNIERYIRLANLEPALLDKVDSKEISFTPAVELASLSQEEQQGFLDAMEYSQNAPSLSQAQRIKKLSKSGKCTVEAMREIMSEEKKSDFDKITIEPDEIKKYFPRSFTPSQMKNTILKLLENWLKNRTKKRNTERS